MIDLSLSGVGKYYGEVQIFKNVSFELQEGEKAALIGKNGCGKTTLFRVIAGAEPCEEGTVIVNRSKRLAVLDQIPQYPAGMTVLDVMKTAFDEIKAIQTQMTQLEAAMSTEKNDPFVLKQYGELQVRFEVLGGYQMETELFRTALGLGVPKEMWQMEYALLSGGEKTRVNLVRMLLQKTEIMLLDEPTNHLDMQAVEWLETYLQSFRGTVLIVSHDRYFLDRVTQKTIELEYQTTTVYNGAYSFYVRRKEEIEEELRRTYDKAQKEIDRLTFTSDRMHGWGLGDKKMMRRAFALDKRIERLRANQPQIQKKDRQLSGKLTNAERSGNDVLYVDGLCKRYDAKIIANHVDLAVKKGESIALLGENGCGKTTFLKMLLGEEMPNSGLIKWGANIQCAYLPQQVSFPDPSATVLETVCLALNLTDGSARNRLGAFHFQGEDVFKTVSVLSGGEKSRLKLCILLYQEINVLILDEPTNHLDIASREWMEGLLESFEGTMLFVSHDRYFIDRFATTIWRMENARFHCFHGTYAQYCKAMAQQESAVPLPREEKPVRDRTADRESPGRRLHRAESALAATEREISATEAALSAIPARLDAVATDPDALIPIYDEQAELEKQLTQLYERWEIETERLEQLKTEEPVR